MTGSRPRGDSPRPVVVMPTYCESDSVLAVIERVRRAAPHFDVLVVDDASPDGTADLVEAYGRDDPAVGLLRRPGKQGLGTAYRDAFGRLLAAGVPYVAQMDADGSHPPESLPGLVAQLADCDLVIGSRWVRGGSVVNWPRHREALSRAANLYARAALGAGVRDVTAGFRIYRSSALTAIGLSTVRSEGYAFQIEMTDRALRAGLRIREVPITFVEREAGASKMSRRIVLEALRRTTGWGVRRVIRGPMLPAQDRPRS